MTDLSNWARALESQRMRLLVSDLIAIGVTLGVEMAERAYLSLREEPRTAQGDRIDWTTIHAAILERRAA